MSKASQLSAALLARLNRQFRKPGKPQYFEGEAYQQWLESGGEQLYEQFYSRYADFAGKTILDLACGYGGKALAYSRQDPAYICGVDLNVGLLGEAQKRPQVSRLVIGFVGADAGRLPFADASFDLVISDDGFDHFKETSRVLDEITRVLKPGGIAFISFVPYYSRECSHMTEYLRVPWHHVLFSQATIRRTLERVAADEARRADADPSAYRSGVEGVFQTFVNHLSRLTVRQFVGQLRDRSGLTLIRMRKQSRYWARPFTYLPVIGEPFTDGVYCVLRKDAAARVTAAALSRQRWLDIKQDAAAFGSRFVRRLQKAARSG